MATGFHLKEYTNQEVVRLFRETGFSRVRVVVNIKVARPRVPVFAMAWIESVIDRLPGSARRSLRPFLRLLGVRVLGTKY